MHLKTSSQGPRAVFVARVSCERGGRHQPAFGIPEPDLAVVRGDPLSFVGRLPGPADVALVVEVSFSTRRVDRMKASIYAQSGYACYWLIDLEAKRVELYRAPTVDGRYGQTEVVDITRELALPLTSMSVSVASLIPQA